MLKINFMSTLFVGIDVSSKSNVVYAMDFYKTKYIQSSFSNNQPGAEEELLAFLATKSKNRITDISKTAKLLKKAARDPYHLD